MQLVEQTGSMSHIQGGIRFKRGAPNKLVVFTNISYACLLHVDVPSYATTGTLCVPALSMQEVSVPNVREYGSVIKTQEPAAVVIADASQILVVTSRTD